MNKLTINNFRSLKSIEVIIPFHACGMNGTGKTSLIDAISWCLSGKDTSGRTNFNCENADVQVTINDKTFCRKFEEKIAKITDEKMGNTTLYSIDFLPVKATDYSDEVAKLFPFPIEMLGNMNYFLTISTEKQIEFFNKLFTLEDSSKPLSNIKLIYKEIKNNLLSQYLKLPEIGQKIETSAFEKELEELFSKTQPKNDKTYDLRKELNEIELSLKKIKIDGDNAANRINSAKNEKCPKCGYIRDEINIAEYTKKIQKLRIDYKKTMEIFNSKREELRKAEINKVITDQNDPRLRINELQKLINEGNLHNGGVDEQKKEFDRINKTIAQAKIKGDSLEKQLNIAEKLFRDICEKNSKKLKEKTGYDFTFFKEDNKGIAQDFDIKQNGLSFMFFSTGEKVKFMLNLINPLSENLNAPIFLDNAESLSSIDFANYKNLTISTLTVTNDKKLIIL